jgi:hypothetical protein
LTGPAAGEPDRGRGAPPRSTGVRDTAGGILGILAAGLALRIIIAYLLPGAGFKVDLDSFRFWAGNLADNGLGGFYQRNFFHDYTPGYLYVLWLVGMVGNALGGVGDLIKIPPILADVALAAVVWALIQDLGGGRRAARLGAILVLFNPITWFDSVIWGQVDSVGLVFLLLGVRELWRDRPERAAILTVVAAIIKPQLGILIPIVAAVTIRRAFWPPGGHGYDPPPAVGTSTTAWERQTRGPLRILTTGLAGLLTAIAISWPFGLSLPDLVSQIFKTAGGYPYVSVNAYNPWALVTLGGRGVAADRAWLCDISVGPSGRLFELGPISIPAGDAYGACASGGVMFGPIPALFVGTLLILAAIAVVSILVAWRPDRRTILVGLAVLALAFFVLPTRVHERYLFPLVGVGAILAAVSTRWRIAYVIASAATFANMYAVLTTLYPGNPNISDWLGIGATLTSWNGVAAAALAHAAVFGWALLQLRPSRLRVLEAEIQVPAEAPVALPAESGRPGPSTAPPGPPSVPLPGSAAGRTVVAASAPGPRTGLEAAVLGARPVWWARPADGARDAWAWFTGRLADRPFRADRSLALRNEGGGRVDRLDIWVIVVLVVSLLTIRIWRLAEPYQMHFDEVYHARTGMEFLQAWRYGISHYIYEWTHPHLAKYAMAGGIVAWGEDRTAATSDLGVRVRDAAIEPRWDEGLDGAARSGDRLWLVTGDELRGYDLANRELVFHAALPGAISVAVDRVSHRVIVGTESGSIDVLATRPLDPDSPGPVLGIATLREGLGSPVLKLHASGDGLSLLAVLGADVVVSLDAGDGTEFGRAAVAGVAQLSDGGTGPALIAHPGSVGDPAAESAILAKLVGRPVADLEALLRSARDPVIVGAVPTGEARTTLDTAIADGRLAGVEVSTVTRVAIAGQNGVTFISPSTGQIVTTVDVGGPTHGLAATIGLDHDSLYVTYDATDGPRMAKVAISGDQAKNGPTLEGHFELPSRGLAVFYDQATQMIHALAERPGAAAGATSGHTVYVIEVIEPHADAVYADAVLDIGNPVALVMDDNQRYPSSDRQELLAFDDGGHAATVEIGRHAFAWRLPGVIAGVLMAALLYILARLLFRRREIALLVAFLTLADGMLFVQSRIGMNDSYVGLFIVAAYTLFAAIWSRPRGWLAFGVLMPLIGVSLGLALAAKWVAAYAIGALGILVLARSALGRVLLVGGLVLVTTALGTMAVSVPAGQTGANYLFLGMMIVLTLATVVAVISHPIAWSAAEHRLAVGAPAAVGVGVVLAALAVGGLDARRVIDPDTRFVIGSIAVTPAEIGVALLVLAGLVEAAFILAGRRGFGPLAPAPEPDDPAALLEPPAPAASGWLNLGSGLGLPAAWTLICLIVIPLVVYVISYVPWAFVEDHQIVAGWPPGHHGQTLADLTAAMYRYHNTLSAPHAASSPWWAWPFDFKPVWFYQESFAGTTAAAIYDAGNLVAWWLAIPALAFAAWWAFKRRSTALALVVIGFACQWLAWSRIDRAAFQYHYYTSLPFVILALAYFLAELRHGAARFTWLIARLAGAAAILAPTTLWLLHRPLCGFVDVLSVNPGSRACPTVIPDFLLTYRALAIAAVVGIGVLILLRLLLTLGREPDDGSEAPAGRTGVGGQVRQLVPLLVAGVGVASALLVARAFFPDEPLLRLTNVPVEPIALLATIALLPLAAYVATARDARRFVAGILVAIGGWFVLWYPNLSALPLPAPMSNTYQGLLPTYVYPFQFPVSKLDRSGPGPNLFDAGPLLLLAALVIACVVLAYSTWIWRLALAERAAAAAYATPDDARGDAGISAR